MMSLRSLLSMVPLAMQIQSVLAATISNTSPPTPITTSVSPGILACSACYAVAPIDQVIQGVGASFYVNLGSFTWNLVQIFEKSGGDVTEAALPTSSIITYNGLPVSDPTMYNVFSSWEVIALTGNERSCITTTIYRENFGPASITIPSAAQLDFAVTAESAIVSVLRQSKGALTCSTGSEGVIISTIIYVQDETAPLTLSTTGTFRPTTIVTFTPSSSVLPETTIAVSFQPSINSTTSAASNMTSTSRSAMYSSSQQSTSSGPGTSGSSRLGLGVGLGVGGALMLVLAGFILWRLVRAKRTHQLEQSEAGICPDEKVGVAADEPGVAVDSILAKRISHSNNTNTKR